jgi:hypothetical protein
MDKITNESEHNPVLGRNSALIPEAFMNCNQKIYERMDFTKILVDLDNLDCIDGNIWYPTESDKEFMSQNAFDEAMAQYKERKSKILFNNVFVNYESCDCGGGYPCNHASFPTEIEVVDSKNMVNHIIGIDGDDSLVFEYNKTEIQINGLKNFTYGDFIRFCKLCDINLESNYIL